jgi:hypothetical protein
VQQIINDMARMATDAGTKEPCAAAPHMAAEVRAFILEPPLSGLSLNMTPVMRERFTAFEYLVSIGICDRICGIRTGTPVAVARPAERRAAGWLPAWARWDSSQHLLGAVVHGRTQDRVTRA